MGTDRYGAAAARLHWLIAGAVLALLAGGFAANAADPEAKRALLRLHLPLGVTVLALTLARLAQAVWDGRAGLRPGPLPGMPRRQRALARATHVLLYVVPLGMVASGIGLVALSGAGPAVFGAEPLPDFGGLPPRAAHGLGARLLAALALLHVAAALHHFVRRNGLLGACGRGERPVAPRPGPADPPHPRRTHDASHRFACRRRSPRHRPRRLRRTGRRPAGDAD